MEKCHPRCIDILLYFCGSIGRRYLSRALDVAAGDGRLSSRFLMKYYMKVDLFDQCPEGVVRAKRAMKGNKRLGYISQARMQDFKWSFQYDAIYMVWCAGYLSRQELVKFLRNAKNHLDQTWVRMSRRTDPDAHIILLDNILQPGEEMYLAKGQLVRAERELEDIFQEAGLIVHARSGRQTMLDGFKDVAVWALY